jgi:hypothetical protein
MAEARSITLPIRLQSGLDPVASITSSMAILQKLEQLALGHAGSTVT